MNVQYSLLFRLLNVFILHHFLSVSAAARTNISTDLSALLALKTHITSDPYGALQSWNIQSPICNWTGVKCGKHHHRVTGLDISSFGLTGSIPPALGNLSFLVSIDISSNNFSRTLPEDLDRLRRLRFFDLGHNNFIGDVPSWFSSFPRLHYLHLSNNNFTSLNSFLLSSTNKSKLVVLDVSFNPFQDEITKSMGNLENLKSLVMNGNGFSGSIPLSIMNISSLETLSLANNSLEGIIPEAIGDLHKLNQLNIQFNQLSGYIPSSIFNISTLETIALSHNALFGALPDGICHQPSVLKGLYLSLNLISGQIPSNLSLCSELQILSLSENRISGTIPGGIGNLEKLQLLYLGSNNLTGPIPSQIGKLHNLQGLAIEHNLLTGSIPFTVFNISLLLELILGTNQLRGIVPYEFGNLTMLRELDLGSNNFTGMIPPIFDKLPKLEVLTLVLNAFSGPLPASIFNISTIRTLSLSENSLSGNLPSNIGSFLPSLEDLLLGENNLHGVLPNSISNASHLMYLNLFSNQFNGSIPNSLGDLNFLQGLGLGANNFTTTIESTSSDECGFIAALTSSRNLKKLDVSANQLNCILPSSLGNFSSSMQEFLASSSNIKGYIPSEIGNLSGLSSLYLYGNDLIGVIPTALNKLSNIQRLDLGSNQLTGNIPNGLCKSNTMGLMGFHQNQLTGSIPDCLGNVSSLRYIYLNSNNLTSGLPASIWNLEDLLEFDISLNSITGSLSSKIGNLKAATIIAMSMNLLSNDIPTTIGDLQRVSQLSLAHNRFQGVIPASMGNMLSLTSLDLSHNMLSGTIPKSLESLTQLVFFNVSFNKLSGEIPTSGPFGNFTSQSFAFNTALCGPERFQVLPCKESMHGSKRKKMFRAIFVVLGIGSLMLIATMAFILVQYRWKKKTPTGLDTLDPTRPQRMSYYELLKATNGYSDGNLLGRGSFGSVYKGILEDGTILAIKVFNMLQELASNTFDAECEALRNLRHRNLIKVITSCSNQDFKAIILEYMPNGSLEKWLYSKNYFLDMMQRLNIITDVANALEYLHHGYLTHVVHCDLKPSNVLMDENMVARVGDFGITKFLGEEESITHTRTLATLGYMAPEYGLDGRVSTRCDVYSYGILVLETFTRKRPSDEMFCDGMNLKNWVKDSLSNALDANLITPGETSFNAKYQCALSVLKLALRCCEDTPGARMNMKDVVAQLKKIKAKFVEQNEGTSNLQILKADV